MVALLWYLLIFYPEKSLESEGFAHDDLAAVAVIMYLDNHHYD